MQVQQGLRHVPHLIRRFFGFLVARPLSPREQRWVQVRLEPQSATLFFAQAPQDQRHAVAVATRVVELGGDDDAVAAALLHDVGKRHADLGAVGRSLATALGGVGVPLRGRYQAYRDHGRLGAADLEAAQAPSLAVAFAGLHPGPVPADQDPDVWRTLTEADQRA